MMLIVDTHCHALQHWCGVGVMAHERHTDSYLTPSLVA